MTPLDLSKRVRMLGANLDRAAVAKIENGLRCVLDYELLALSGVLKVRVDWLLGIRALRKARPRKSCRPR